MTWHITTRRKTLTPRCFDFLKLSGASAILALAAFSACSTTMIYNKSLNSFEKSLKVFDNLLDNKRSSLCLQFVYLTERESCVAAVNEISQRVSIEETQTLSTLFFKNGEPAPMDSGPVTEIDEAEVNMLYRIVVSPSNRLRTIRVRHRWKLIEDKWLVLPELQPFLK